MTEPLDSARMTGGGHTDADAVRASPHDVIVVLGCALATGGRPTRALRRRVSHAVGQWRRGAAPWLMLCGGVVRHPPTEAEAMAALAREAGVPAAALLLERRSCSTWENAACAKRLMREHGWTRALLVTDRVHLPRAVVTFRRAGVRVAASGAPGAWREEPPARAVRALAREAAALAWYAIRLTVARPR